MPLAQTSMSNPTLQLPEPEQSVTDLQTDANLVTAVEDCAGADSLRNSAGLSAEELESSATARSRVVSKV